MTTIILLSVAPIILFGISIPYAYRRGCETEDRLRIEEDRNIENTQG